MDSGLGTYVTYNPASVTPETAIDDLLRMVEGLAIHDFPVVDAEQRLIGVVAETDLLRLASERKRNEQEEMTLADSTAAAVVSSDLVTVDQAASPRQALKLLIDRCIHALPVLDQGRLIGIVSTSDFLREFSYGQMTCAKEPVSDFLSKPAEPLEPDSTVEGALQAMDKARVDHLAVVQGGCPIGIVSRREIQKLLSLRGREQPVSGAASVLKVLRKTPAFRPGQRMNEAAALMLEHGLSALAVTNQANRFLGMVTEDEILQVMLRGLKG